LAARGAASSRSQLESDSAMPQLSMAGGLTATRLLSASHTALSWTMSAPPQVAGPTRRGIGSASAKPASLASQSVG
jgi:hypothetical protein